MSAKIADFTLRFDAETAQFKKDVDYAKKMLRGYTKDANAANDSNGNFSKSLEQSADRAKNAGVNFLKLTSAAAASVTGVAAATGYLITRQAEQSRQIERMATVSGLAVEEIQALGYASEQYNISGDKMADMLKDVQDKLGDFSNVAGGEFKDFFEQVAPKIGLTVEELSKLSSPEVLIAVKEAMDAANVPMKQQITYLEAIANDATALLPLLENKGKKLFELTQHYDDLNVAMSEFDIKNFKEMDQKITDVALKIEKSFATAVLGAREQIDWFTDQLTTSVAWWGDLFDSWTDDPKTRGGLVKRLSNLRSEIGPLKSEAEKLSDELKKLDSETSAENPWGKFQKKTLENQILQIKSKIKPLQAEIDKLQTEYGERYLGLNTEPPELKSNTSNDVTPESSGPLTDVSRLDALEMQLASEREKLKLSHDQRLADIRAFNFAEKEVTERGFQSLEELKQSYIARETEFHEQKITEFETKQNEANARELAAIQQTEQAKVDAVDKAAKQRFNIENQLNQQIISMQFQVAGQALSIIENSAKEGSFIQEAAFIAQKTMAAAQVFIQGEVAAMSALAPPPVGLGVVAGASYATAIRGMAGVSAGMIMGQAISGMAHNGMDAIPSEGTWLLDRGERVYTNESAKRLDQMYRAIMSLYTAWKAPAANEASYRQAAQAVSSGNNALQFEQHFHMDSSTNQQTIQQTAQTMRQVAEEIIANNLRPGGMLNR